MLQDGSKDERKSVRAFEALVDNALASSKAMALLSWVSTALNHSVVKQSVDTLGRFARASVLYRWATETPDESTVDLNQAVFGAVVARIFIFVTETYPAAIRDSAAIHQYHDLETTILSAPLRLLGFTLLLAGNIGVAANLASGAATQPQTLACVALAGIGLLLSQIETPWAELSNAKVVKLWRGR